ncbi:MAG: sodium:calcium antiporter, partial [Endomicrobiia bacterium]
MSEIFLFVIGVVIIYFGANLLVLGAGKFARSIGVSPLIIGLTIIGIGTSLPETVVGVLSGLKKTSEISFGNILGADIFDLCLVIGVSALVRPLIVNVKLVQREIKWFLAVILILFLVSIDGTINFINGLILFIFCIIYILYCYSCAKKEKKDAEILEKETSEIVTPDKKIGLYLFQTILGLVILILGGEIIVETAVRFVKTWNLTQEFVGMTLVSFGTALPEFTTSVVASFRSEPDISIGNVIGTVIYNTSA